MTGQPFEVKPDWSEQTVTLITNPEQWFRLGASHDMMEVYGWGKIEDVLQGVNIDIISLLYPVNIVPLIPQSKGIHEFRPEIDYSVDFSELPEGYIMLNEVRLEYPLT